MARGIADRAARSRQGREALRVVAGIVNQCSCQAQAEQVRKRELKSKSFTAGSLKMTITRFYESGRDPKGNFDRTLLMTPLIH